MNEVDPGRRHDLDWLRVIAILLLLFYHSGQIFNTWDWHIKNNETSKFFSYWMILLHNVRMPLLLFISGAGTYMALGKRTVDKFVRERFKRLAIPFIFGMFVIVPPCVYFEYIQDFDSYWDVYKSFSDYIPYRGEVLNWYHLWFIAHLFVYSLVAIPVLIFLRSARSEQFKARGLRVLSNPIGVLLLPSSFILLTQVALRSEFPGVFKGWAFFVFYFCFFLFGLICYSVTSVRESISKNRMYFLVASAILFGLRIVSFIIKRYYPIVDEKTLEAGIEVLSIFIGWCYVITIIGYGQHYLNRPHKLLGRMTEGAYPFYIIHQPILIFVGYNICQLPWSISAKYWTTSLITLVTCVVFYLVCIRPFNIVRFFFGMKLKPKL